MAAAVNRLEEALGRGEVAHTPDLRLDRHVGNVRVRETPAGRLIGKEAQDSPRRIDAAVAMVLAYEARADARTDAPARSRVPFSWS